MMRLVSCFLLGVIFRSLLVIKTVIDVKAGAKTFLDQLRIHYHALLRGEHRCLENMLLRNTTIGVKPRVTSRCQVVLCS